ncbi:MAG: sulfite exporter TauE/SafE family protein [Dehalococcoidia bacterium]
MNPIEIGLLVLLGIFAGTYGTIIGAGGGFILVPALAWVPAYAALSAEALTGVSLVAVFCNAVSAVIAYWRQRRIDVPIALTLGLFAVPGSVLGRTVVTWLDRNRFEAAFGALLVAIAVYLVVRKPPINRSAGDKPPPPGVLRRSYRLLAGEQTTVDVDMRIGAVASFLIGFLASLFGVGGGLMMVPTMVSLMSVPPIVATATSQMYLLTTSGVSLTTDLFNGGASPLEHLGLALPLSVGVIVGAQVGARISRRLGARWIVRMLAVALGLAGARLVWAGLSG